VRKRQFYEFSDSFPTSTISSIPSPSVLQSDSIIPSDPEILATGLSYTSKKSRRIGDRVKNPAEIFILRNAIEHVKNYILFEGPFPTVDKWIIVQAKIWERAEEEVKKRADISIASEAVVS
jgi:hypothetical protein